MADVVDPAKRSEMMAGIGAKNTKPELVVRQALHRLGYRFRLHRKDLPGKPDIVLPKWKTVIFVHGCFWHGHENCPLFRLPKSRTEFWKEKIAANLQRDKAVREKLHKAHWRQIEVWECATKGRMAFAPELLEQRIDEAMKSASTQYIEIRGAQIA